MMPKTTTGGMSSSFEKHRQRLRDLESQLEAKKALRFQLADRKLEELTAFKEQVRMRTQRFNLKERERELSISNGILIKHLMSINNNQSFK